MRDALVYCLLALALYLAWYLTRAAVDGVRRLEHRDAEEARTRG